MKRITHSSKTRLKKIVTKEEIAISNMFQIETILRLLAKKSVITKQECIDKMKELKREMVKKWTLESRGHWFLN